MDLHKTAKDLVIDSKGILAADESIGTIQKRFDSINIENNEENRRIYRELLFTTGGIEQFISGVILFDETTKHCVYGGRSMVQVLSDKGIIPGVKVDQGKVPLPNFPNEEITAGLDGLRERLDWYKGMGIRFAKWRAVVKIGKDLPTDVSIEVNAQNLALYAAICQEKEIVPIVEPEVLMDGDHVLKKTREVTYRTLKKVFERLSTHKVDLSGMLLKPNMIVPGKNCQEEFSNEEIAKATLETFKEVVPPQVGGIVFLSGGLSPQKSTELLNEMNKIDEAAWPLSFSFGRALQEPVLKAWAGNSENWQGAQKEFYKRAKLNSFARAGKYKPELEN